eukprot:5210398-Pleurochrysis_carterae.AAC.3
MGYVVIAGVRTKLRNMVKSQMRNTFQPSKIRVEFIVKGCIEVEDSGRVEASMKAKVKANVKVLHLAESYCWTLKQARQARGAHLCGEERDERHYDCSDSPRGLPALRVVCRDREADLLAQLEAAVWRQQRD